MPVLYGPHRSFATRRAAEAFARHLTRELTAGGLPHWVEIQEAVPGRFVAYVHQYDCRAGGACQCGRDQ